ncbi:MAG: MraY family glycosyltransferase [Prosthecobacter sp.]|nr:MraY family glycosyltransferase [Prosthecobacter sp.]
MLPFAIEAAEFIGPPAPNLPGNAEIAAYFVAAAALTCLCVIGLLRRNAAIGMDAPDGRRKLHDRPILRIGGAPIFIALLAGLAMSIVTKRLEWSTWMPLILCNALIFSVGFADDLKPLGARVKLIGQIGAALILFALGLSIDVLSNPFGGGGLPLGWWSLPLTLLWLVAIPNIINLIDGMDGLAGGFGLFLALTLASVGYISGQGDVVMASVVMAGALAGFLFFNFPPAKIFLGDGGAYLIGFFVASVSLKSSNKGSVIAALLVIVIALGVPILDTAFAILRRSIRGVPIFSADAEHIHHRLILLGYSKPRALAAMYTVCLVLSLGGISVLLTKGITFPVAGAVMFLLAIGAARYLGYVRSWTNLRQQIHEAMERRRRLEHARAHARVLEFDFEKCESVDELSTVLRYRLGWIGFKTEQEPGTVPLELVLASGVKCALYRPDDQDAPDDWNRRADPFVSILERCVDKWGVLPSLLPATDPAADQEKVDA